MTHKIFTCKKCNFSTRYKHVINSHIKRKKDCSINNVNITTETKYEAVENSNYIPVRVLRKILDEEEEQELSAEQDDNSADNKALNLLNLMIEANDTQEISNVIKIYYTEYLDEEEQQQFLDDIISL